MAFGLVYTFIQSITMELCVTMSHSLGLSFCPGGIEDIVPY